MSSEGGGTARRRPVAFHFINANPLSEAERSQSRLLVRSHVGKWAWQQIKARSARAESDDAEESGDPGCGKRKSRGATDTDNIGAASSTSLPSASSRSPAVDRRPRGWQSQRMTSPESQTRGTSNRGMIALSRLSSNAPGRSSPYGLWPSRTSIDYTGSAPVDPFQTYPSTLPADFVNSCMTNSLSVLWPGLTPRSPNTPSSPALAVSGWLPLAMDDPTAFIALTFGSLSHKRIRWISSKGQDKAGAPAFSAREKRGLALCEMETVKMINRALQDPARAASDAVILSVLCLAHNRAEESDSERLNKDAYGKKDVVRSPFRAPLRSLQWLDIYGTLLPHPVHMSGLAQLVGMRGVENIQLAGLAPILSYSDILTASRTLSHPRLPFIPLGGNDSDINESRSLQGRFNFTPTDVDAHFSHLYPLEFTFELAETLHAMRIYTSIVNDYLDGSLVDPDMSLISDHRNCVQHAIMSLPAGRDLGPGFENDHPMYEICRLAAVIFSVGVIFPLPGEAAPIPALVRQLVAELQTPCLLEQSYWSSSSSSSSAAVQVLLWVLTLGGIAAATGETIPERSWLVASLQRFAIHHAGKFRWIDLKREILEQMVWLDSACDAAGQELWEEVERSSPGQGLEESSRMAA